MNPDCSLGDGEAAVLLMLLSAAAEAVQRLADRLELVRRLANHPTAGVDPPEAENP